MDLDNLVSGLIGALVGIGGALWLQGRERAEAKKMACRAVYIEMKGNAAAMLARGSPAGLTSVMAWESQFLVLASVNVADGTDITVAYKGIEAYRSGSLDPGTVMEQIMPALTILERKGGEK